MALTPEAKVKQRVVKQLKEMGAYYFFPVTGGFGNSGIPDIVGCIRGRFFAIECKAGKNTTTRLQDSHLEEIRKQGGVALLINGDNAHLVEELLKDFL
jgi:Holliday junction resolvase